MRKIARSLLVALLALLGAVILAISWTMTTAIQLQATTALIMSGTFVPDPDAVYVADVTQRYINPFADLPYDTAPVGVHTPEEFFPVFGNLTFDKSVAEGVVDLQDAVDANTPNADDRVLIFGYSQSARIATIAKRNFIADYDPAHPDATPIAGFVLLADPNKANGGILERYKFVGTIPLLGITFDGDAPTNGPQNPDGSYVAPTKDISFLYDGVSDHPVQITNVLAMANALAGYLYLHSETPTADANLIYQGSAGDTDYYIIDPDIVPLLRPLEDIGVPHFILSALDEPLRVLIETAYRRDLGPGVPVHASVLPHPTPLRTTRNLIKSIPVGIDDATEELGLGRRLGTTPPGPYGVGGPPLPPPPAPVSALSPSTAPEAPAVQKDSEPQVAARNDVESKSAQKNSASAAPSPSENDATKPDTKKADRLRLRVPSQFDLKKKPKESPSSRSDEPSASAERAAVKRKPTAGSGPKGSSESSESESKAAA